MDFIHTHWNSLYFVQEFVGCVKFALKSLDTAHVGHMPTIPILIAISIVIQIAITSIHYQWRCSPVDVCIGSAFTGEYLHW